LFGAPVPNYFSLLESEVDDITQISQEENDILIADFTEKEVYDAIMQMKKIRLRDLMGFPHNFTKLFGTLLNLI
jgi:ribosomal protein L16 Arg81 hydroxylase